MRLFPSSHNDNLKKSVRMCVWASCRTAPDSSAFGCSPSVTEEREVSHNIQGLVMFHLFVVNQWNIRVPLWLYWFQHVPLKICV